VAHRDGKSEEGRDPIMALFHIEHEGNRRTAVLESENCSKNITTIQVCEFGQTGQAAWRLVNQRLFFLASYLRNLVWNFSMMKIIR
jgi:hypothetical protein